MDTVNDCGVETSSSRELSISEIHTIEHEMLGAIATVCSNAGITWWLAYGTLLGTIRSNALIPWDDDADIWIPRHEFKRFVDTWRDTERYRLILPFAKPYGFGWAKIIDRFTSYYNDEVVLPDDYGLALDVFIRDDACGKRAFNKIHRQQTMRALAWRPLRKGGPTSIKRGAKQLLHPLAGVLPKSLYNERAFSSVLENGQKRTPDSSSFTINAHCGYPYARDLMPKEWFEGCRTEICDGYEYPVPIHAEEILEQLYGPNWRTPVEYPRHAHLFWR